MEVDDSMVAIVRSSRHAGFTVTLFPERRTTCKKSQHETGMKTTNGNRSNVETNTERKKNSSGPAWDCRYDSGHQFANCPRLPTYQQRNEFTGFGSGEMEQSLSAAAGPQSFMRHRRLKCDQGPYHLKGSQFSPCPSMSMGHFMQSLRRYPSATSSAELVQRLLDYTHSKHHAKKRHSRSNKALLRKSTSQQTNREDAAPEETSAGKHRHRHLSAVGQRCSSQEELLKYTYDYLKSATYVRGRADVRYLTEIRRALRDKLREIIDSKAEESHVCPNLQSRYIRHKKLCQGRHPGNASTSPKESTLNEGVSPTPCVCDPEVEQVKSFEVQLFNVVNDWVKCIPVYPDFSEKDKKKREDILNELTNNLKELERTHFNLNAKKEILQSLDALPMWHPTDSNEDTLLKEHLADKLIERLSKIDKDNANTTETYEKQDYKGIKFNLERINSNDVENMPYKSGSRPKQGAVKYSLDDKQYTDALKSQHLEIIEDQPQKHENGMTTFNSGISPQQLRTTELSTKKIKLSDFSGPNNKKVTAQKEEQEEFHNSEIDKYDSKDLKVRESITLNNESFKRAQNEVSDVNKDIQDSSYFSPQEHKDLDTFLRKRMSEYDDPRVSTSKTSDINNLALLRKHQQMVSDRSKDIPELFHLDNLEKKKLTKFQKNKIIEYDPKDLEVSEILTSESEESAQEISKDSDSNINDEDTVLLKNHQNVSHHTKDIQKLSHLYPQEQNKLTQFQNNKISEYNPENIEESDIQNKEYNEWLKMAADNPDSQNKSKIKQQIKLESPLEESKTDDENKLRLIKNHEIPQSSRVHTIDQKDLANFRKKFDSDDIEQSQRKINDENILGLKKSDQHKISKWTKHKPELYLPGHKEFAKIQKNEMGEYDSEGIDVSESQQRELVENDEWLNMDTTNRRIDLQNKQKYGERLKKEVPSVESISDNENILLKQSSQLKVFKWNKETPELSHFYPPEEQRNLEKFKTNEIGTSELKDKADNEVQQNLQSKKIKLSNKAAINGYEDLQNKNNFTKNKTQELNDESLLNIVNKWFQGIPKLADDKINNKKDLRNLATQLYEIQTSGEDFENIQVDLWEAITDWLQHMLRKNKKRLSSASLENLVHKLVNTINDIPKPKIYMQNERDIHKDIVTLLKDIPGLDSNLDLDEYNAIGDLINTLNDIRNSDEFVEDRTRDAINSFIEILSEDTGVNLLPKDQELLKQALLKRYKQEQQQRTLNEQIHIGTSTPKTPTHYYSFSPNLSPISNVSLDGGQTELNEYLNTLNHVIDSWVRGLQLTTGAAELRNLIGDIVSDIVDRQKYLQLADTKTLEADELEHLKYQIFRKLNKLNVDDIPKAISKVDDLNKRITSIKAPDLTKKTNRSDLTRRISNLVITLKTWLDNIPNDLASHTDPNSDEVFLELAYKLADLECTINYYNLKNEICQWLPTIFNNIDKNTLNNLAESLIKYLINNFSQDTSNTGSMYRLMLWDTISKTLPPINLAPADDLHAFDLHKERLVDAFINLHYFSEDMVALDKFKTKLLDEVNKFCNEYLQRYPDSPINPEELSRNLYSALRNVSLPDIETVRSELEQVRLKDEIMDWLQTVPIDKSKITEAQLNAKVSDLAKRLYGLEKNKHFDQNKYDEMKHGIIMWLQTLLAKDDEHLTPFVFADVLINKLKNTDKSRTLSVSNIGKHGDNIIAQYPQSNLSVEERAHLDRIRRRSDYSRGKMQSSLCADICVRSPLRESGMQTETNSKIDATCHTRPAFYFGRPKDREVSPQVIIKEYYWDSTINNGSQRCLHASRPSAPCPPCCKVSETASKMIRIGKLTKNSNAQTDQALNNTCPKSSQDRTSNHRCYSLDDRKHASRPPPCYFPESIRNSSQTVNLPSETLISIKSKDDIGSNYGQPRHINCKRRNCSNKSHCNAPAPETRLKYCQNCVSGCPYPCNMFFKKEF